MSGSAVKPRAREGLLAADHSKRGRRFVTILDPTSQQVTLLESWEHAVLVLCDGSRTSAQISELLAPSVDGQPIDGEVVHRCLKFFERQSLIVQAGLRNSDLPPPGPVTLTALQQAYHEWHKEPVRTGAKSLPPPFPNTGIRAPIGLDPTVALSGDEDEASASRVQVGSTLMLAGVGGGSTSLLDGDDEDASGDEEESVLDLLAAVDHAVAEAGALEAASKDKKRPAKRRIDTAEIQLTESRPMKSGVHEKPKTKIEVAPEMDSGPPKPPSALRPSFRPPADSVLRPTMVGLPPEPTGAGPRPASQPGVHRPTVPPEPLTVQTERKSEPPRPVVLEEADFERREPVRLVDLLGTDITETETVSTHAVDLSKREIKKPDLRKRPISPRRPKSEPTERVGVRPQGDLEDEQPTQLGRMVTVDDK